MRVLSGLLAAVVLIACPSIAVADEATIKDSTDDVYGSVPEGFEQVEPVGTRVNTDLRKVVVSHRANAVVMKVRYVDLVAGESAFIKYEAYLNLPPGLDDIFVFVRVRPSLEKASVELFGTLGAFPCQGAKAAAEPAKDLVRVRVPRSCLENPEWIRVSGQSESRGKGERHFFDWGNTAGDYDAKNPQTGRLYAG